MPDIEDALVSLRTAVDAITQERPREHLQRVRIAKEVGPLLKAAREARGWSEEKLAKTADMNVRQIYRLEQGRALPDARWFRPILWVLQRQDA